LRNSAGPSVLYICSPGHSGSTLADLLAGSIPGVFSAGEIRYFPWQLHRQIHEVVSIGNQNICTCGSPFFECEVWQKVVNILYKEQKCIIESPLDFNISFLRQPKYGSPDSLFARGFRGIISRASRSSANQLAWAIAKRVLSRTIYNNWSMFQAIGHTTSNSYVVDSTKDPFRLWMLSQSNPQFLRLIILKRDVLGVASSGAKRGKDPIVCALAWKEFYVRLRKLISFMPDLRFIELHYEDLCRNPVYTLKKIAEFLEINEVISLIGDLLPIDTTERHMIAGNPMRYSGRLKIRPDNSWKSILSPTQISHIRSIEERAWESH